MVVIHDTNGAFVRVELSFENESLQNIMGTSNVYVHARPNGPAYLINGCHESQLNALDSGLSELGLRFDDIERVIYTSWQPHITGTIEAMPNAGHVLFSPDLERPGSLRDEWDARRAELAQIMQHNGHESQVDTVLACPETISFVPVLDGHQVFAGAPLKVVAAPGPDAGHCMLWDADAKALFTGELAYSGVPYWVDEIQGYLVAFERALAFDPKHVLPNRGAPASRGTWMLHRALRWSNNFLTNVSGLLFGAPTLRQFVERDLGRDDLAPLELALRMASVRPLLEELVRANMIQVAAEGLETRYGVNIQDPSAHMRPWA